MTRIIYWNIERFSTAKIDVANANPVLAAQSVDRLGVIEDVFAPTLGGGEEEMEWQEPPPDIFVVVEVSARTDPVIPEGYSLFTGSPGGRAVRQLLANFRAAFGPQWSLVPPLFLGGGGYREGVAVFYNSENLLFAGPYLWSQPGIQPLPLGRPATAANLEALQNYSAGWVAGMPEGRTWPLEIEGVAHEVPERQSAGQWEFFNEGARIYFPGWENRSPFYTRFVDLAGGRVLKLFSVHTSPATSQQAVQRLAGIQELTPAENEVSVIVGDFNVDTFMAGAGAYNGLLERNFDILLDPRVPGEEAVNLARKPYCMTHILPIAQARPWNAVGGPNTTHNAYPRFGYMGSVIPGGGLSEAGAIDNALVRYGAGVHEPKASVVNKVVGTPYNQLAEPPAGVTEELTTGAPYRSGMANQIPLPGGVEEPGDIEGEFRSWENYGKIRSTSDHLPLAVEV